MPKGAQARELTEREKLEVDVRQVRASIEYRKDILKSCRNELELARKRVKAAEDHVARWNDDVAVAELALANYEEGDG